MKYELEVQALLKKARRSLKASKSLIDSEDYDFSISRAYYAMFYCAEALLLTKDMKFSKHSAVIAFFGREFVKSGLLSEEFYGYLLKGFRERQLSDYETMKLPLLEDAEELAQKAGIFLEATKMYLKKIGHKFENIA
jgi:uncharacterized protein (UPF0332 family)